MTAGGRSGGKWAAVAVNAPPRRQTPMATTDVAAVVSSVAMQSRYPVCGWLLVAAQWLGAVHREVEWFRN
jgi:hypothetical protein